MLPPAQRDTYGITPKFVYTSYLPEIYSEIALTHQPLSVVKQTAIADLSLGLHPQEEAAPRALLPPSLTVPAHCKILLRLKLRLKILYHDSITTRTTLILLRIC